jgi:hypothetical protein
MCTGAFLVAPEKSGASTSGLKPLAYATRLTLRAAERPSSCRTGAMSGLSQGLEALGSGQLAQGNSAAAWIASRTRG